MKPDTYYLARIQTFNYFIGSMEANGEKNSPRELLKVGFVDESIREQIKEEIIVNQKFISDSDKLSFTDLTTFNTWYAMHPEKVCGIEKVTTSMNFPLKIIGDKDLIIKTIEQDLQNKVSDYFKIEKENPKLKLLKLKLKLQTQTLELLLKL
jgi:hypothetical protein